MGALSLLMATCPGALEVGWMACDDESGQWRSKRHTVDARAGSAQEMEGVNGNETTLPLMNQDIPPKSPAGVMSTCEQLLLEGGFHTFG